MNVPLASATLDDRPPRADVPAGLSGLSSVEAAGRLREVGPNRWVAPTRWARARELIRLLSDPMAVMLVIASAVYFLLGETRDGVVLAVALVPVLGIDVLLEARSRAALDRLARAAAAQATVLRDGHLLDVDAEALVPGDVVALQEGHTVPADGDVLWGANLALDESSLTGESDPQVKAPLPAPGAPGRHANSLFAGSRVLSGHGFMRITATGSRTRYGGIAALVAGTDPSPSPLQRRAGLLAGQLGLAALLVAVGLCLLSVARGEPWTRAILGGVSLAMAAIPEEFPVVLTLFLSVGAWRLAGRGMLVRRLASVETLGSTTVICTDKTGTLTRGEFQVTRHVVLDASTSDTDLLEAAVLACEQHPSDAMERAIVTYAESLGVAAGPLAGRWALLRDYDFDSDGKHMSHVWQSARGDGGFFIVAKGAVEGLLAHGDSGSDVVARVRQGNEDLAGQGLRVLAVAGRRASILGSTRVEDEQGLVVYGLIGFEDPLRPEVPAAIAECQQAGIRVVMITGDHPLTAHAVADAAGIAHDDRAMVTSDELQALPEAARAQRIQRAAICSRITPEQKFWIVDALRRGGAIVAMTGDGVNDAPALRRADIGIAMGRRGTDVARATADLVLLDDNFASIVAAVREGRHIFQNVQRAFLYLTAFHIPIVALALLVPLAGLPLLLLPIHLVWLELIVHPVSAFVFQAEPISAAVMQRAPRSPSAPLLPREAALRSVASGGALALMSLAVYWWYGRMADERVARALALVVLVAGYETLVFAERLALPDVRIDVIPRTWVFWTMWTLTALSLVAALYLPPVAELFGVVPPPTPDLWIAAALGVLAVGWRLVIVRPTA